MNNRVAIVGVGATPFRATSPQVSYREMIYSAAVQAYEDAGLQAKEIQSFVSCTEDLIEGTSIADEYCPDQLGAATKPVHTISGDGIHGLASAVMLIRSGLFDLMAVEAHSKASNIDCIDNILTYAMDPVMHRAVGLPPTAIAGLEMRRFLHESKRTAFDCADVVVVNRRNALNNPLASNGGSVTRDHVLKSKEVSSPLHEAEIAPHADGAIVVVLASEKMAGGHPVWVHGISWASDTYSLESRDWGRARYLSDSARRAYSMAGQAREKINLAEVDNTFAYKELQHLEALGLAEKEKSLPVNPSGGVMGCGNLGEANGLARILECVLQIRGEAGPRQIENVQNALAASWRGLPSSSGAVVILGKDKP